MKKIIVLALSVLFGGCFMLAGCGESSNVDRGVSLWDFQTLSERVPFVREAGYTYAQSDNIRAIYFEGAEYNGEATEIFAFLGVPKTQKPANGYPAVVLVHGGLGQAYGDWVKLWTDRGYVALALSVDANCTDGSNQASQNPKGGPHISIKPADMQNPENSWEYISVANIITGHNILRGMEEVDSSNIGITGISWGSYLTCVAVGVDSRFAFGIPVYGAGYNYENVTGELAGVFQMDDASMTVYAEKFDPAVYMKNCNIPLFWVAGANDFAFSLACNQKCADENRGENVFSWRGKLVHGQQPGDGSGIPEIFLFADKIVKGADSLIRVDEGTVNGGAVAMNIRNDIAVEKAYLYWSSYPLEFWHDAGNVWSREEVALSGNSLSIAVPAEAVYGFVEITDANGHVVSSRLFTF